MNKINESNENENLNSNIEKALTNSLTNYFNYIYSENKKKEFLDLEHKLKSDFRELSSLNEKYLKIILKNVKNLKSNNLNEIFIQDIIKVYKSKNKMKFYCALWACFYYCSGIYFVKTFNLRPWNKIFFMAVYMSTLVYYYKKMFKFKDSQMHLHILRHTIHHFSIVHNDKFIETFMQEYGYFFRQGELLKGRKIRWKV